jgi:hypothetical protein
MHNSLVQKSLVLDSLLTDHPRRACEAFINRARTIFFEELCDHTCSARELLRVRPDDLPQSAA